MDSKETQFLGKLKIEPREVSLYFSSNLNTSINKELINKFNIEIDIIHNLTMDFFIEDYNFSNLRKSVQATPIIRDRPNEFICDFLGKLFLPIAELIKRDVAKEINFSGGDFNNYKKYTLDLVDLINKENKTVALSLVDDFENNFDIKEEEKIVITFLNENIIDILSSTDNSGCVQLNGSLTYLIINSKDSLSKFVNAFLSNKEIISDKRIIINSKESEASVSNFIKHFISLNGSGIFSSIALAKYLSSAEINNLLDEKGKKLLRKIFKIYRNLVFFPDSMANIPLEEWRIFPFEDMVEVVTLPENKAHYEPVDSREQEVLVLKELLKKYSDKGLEKKAIENEIKIIEEN